MREELASALAGAFLAGDWTAAGLVGSGSRVLRGRRAWLPVLSREVLELYPRAPQDRPRELAAVVRSRPAAARAKRARPVSRVVAPTRMVVNPWHLPVLDDLSQLAALVGLTQAELAWFSDPKHWARTATSAALQHYRVSTRPAPSGAVRVLEAPKHRLRTVQRLLLDRVLDGVPAHDAAHGFRRAAPSPPSPPRTPVGPSCCGWTSRASSPASPSGGCTAPSGPPATRSRWRTAWPDW